MTTMRNKLTAVREQVRVAYRNGATLREIAEAHETSSGTVRGVLIEMGETLRRRGRRRKADEDAEVAIPAIDLDDLVEEERYEGEYTYEGGEL